MMRWSTTSSRPRRASIVSAIAALAWCSPGAASAGPWTLPAGDLRIYLSLEHRADDTRFDADGERADGTRRQLAGSVTTEYGATDWLTFSLRTEGRVTRLDSDGSDRTNRGVTKYGGAVRARLFKTDRLVGSVSAGVGVAGAFDPDLRPELDDGASEAELRGLLGYGFSSPLGDGWLAGEAAYRARNDDASDQVRLDATAGVRPPLDDRVMLMVQGFGTIAAGRGDRSDFDSLKLAPSIAYEATDWATVRLGAGREVVANGVEPGTTVMLDVWFSF